MAREWIIENTWNCLACRKLNKGRDLACRECSMPKQVGSVDTQVASAVVTDPERLAEARVGLWLCGFCGCQMRDLKGTCEHCGGAQDHQLPKAQAKRKPGDPSYWATHRGKLMYAGWIIVGLLLVGTLVKGCIWLLTPREVNAQVTETRWKYTENLRERETKSDSGWGRPGDRGFYDEAAFNVSCHSKYHSEEKCRPHNCRPHQESYRCRCESYSCNCHDVCTDNGNGYSSCRQSCSTCTRCDTCSETKYDTCYDSCPVYKDWCSYSYYDWPVRETKQTEGFTHEVNWPGIIPQPQKVQRVQKVEHYHVVFRDSKENETLVYEPKELATFKRFFVGDSWKLEVQRVTGTPTPVKKLSAEAE